MDKTIDLTWNSLELAKPQRPTLRNSHSLCSNNNNELYLFGGRSRGGSNNHIYVITKSGIKEGWKQFDPRGTPPPPRKSSSIAYLDGLVYVFGGNTKHGLVNDFYHFDLTNLSWSQVTGVNGSPPCARDRHTMRAVAGKLWIFGGHSEDDEFLNDLYSFDPKRKRWCKHFTSNPPTARYEHCAVALEKKMIIAGGKCKRGGLSDIHIFDADVNKWTRPKLRGTVPQCRWGSSLVSYNKYLLFFGGWNGRECFEDVIAVDSNTWEYLPSIKTKGETPVSRTFHEAGILGSSMVLIAGRNMTRRLNDTHLLDLSKLSTSSSLTKVNSISDENVTKTHSVITKPTTSDANFEPQSQLSKDFRNGKSIDKSKFELMTTLGTGSFGRVRLCVYTSKKEYFAMKILRKTRVIKMKQENHIKWEKRILTGIRHPFIVNLEAFFQDSKFLYLVLELVQGGEFFSLLRKTGVLQLPHAAFYASQIVLIFQFLHKNKIVYRDLKPENLLIGRDGYLKLTDFGFAKRLDKTPPLTWTLCGTPEYIAPEILLNKGHSFSVDWWALGILLFEMFTGNPPFCDENPMRIYQKILDAKVAYTNDIPRKAQSFISKLLTPNLTRRLGNLNGGAMDVMMDPFFNGVSWRQVLEKKVRAPYIPRVENEFDTQHFDDYDEKSDTEDQEPLKKDPFLTDF